MFIILFHLWSSISQLGTEVVTIHVLSLIVYFIAIQYQYKWTFRIEESRPWNRNRYAHTSPHFEYQPWRHQWCQDNLIHTFTAYENLDEKSYTRRWGTIKSWLSNTSGDKRHVGHWSIWFNVDEKATTDCWRVGWLMTLFITVNSTFCKLKCIKTI